MVPENNPPPELPSAPGFLVLPGAGKLPQGQTRVFEFLRKGYKVEGILVHHEKGFSAFLNQCQHWPIPLDFGDGEFLDPSIQRLRCKTHGATYLPETGLCDSGPCARSQLTRYEVEMKGDDVGVRLTEA